MIYPIVELRVEPFERQENTIVYPIKIKLHTNQLIELKYQYSEFIHFSKSLHQDYPFLVKKYQLPKINKRKKFFNYYSSSFKASPKILLERQSEIELFCQQLLSLPFSIRSSILFLSFFIKKQKEKSLTGAPIKRKFSTDHFVHSTQIGKESLIKFKVVYDKDNIIVIRVPRSITFKALRLQVILKFDLLNIHLSEQTLFRVVDKLDSTLPRYSILSTSTASTLDSSIVIQSLDDSSLSSDVILYDDQDLFKVINEKPSSNQKITLHCII